MAVGKKASVLYTLVSSSKDRIFNAFEVHSQIESPFPITSLVINQHVLQTLLMFYMLGWVTLPFLRCSILIHVSLTCLRIFLVILV